MGRSRSPAKSTGRDKSREGRKTKREKKSSSSSSSSSSSPSRSHSSPPQKKRSHSSSKSQEKRQDKKKVRRRRSSSTSSSSDSSSSSSSSDSSDEETRKKKKKRRKVKKMKAREKKKERKERKKQKKKMKQLRKISGKETPSLPLDPQMPTNKLSSSLEMWQTEGSVEHGPVMTDEQKARLSTKRPLTKEEWEAQQSIIRRVVDPETGRTRLVRGEGEILEEIVSRDKHKEINKQATKGDGSAFQRRLGINR